MKHYYNPHSFLTLEQDEDWWDEPSYIIGRDDRNDSDEDGLKRFWYCLSGPRDDDEIDGEVL
jgi:hypothetical protein